MPALDDLLVTVQPDWSGWETAQIRLRDLEDVVWLQPEGAPRPLLHGYIRCTQVESGTLPHACEGAAAHRLLVCVLKSHNTPAVFAALTEKADQGGVRSLADGSMRRPRARGLFRMRSLLLTAAAIMLGLGAYGWHRAHATGHG